MFKKLTKSNNLVYEKVELTFTVKEKLEVAERNKMGSYSMISNFNYENEELPGDMMNKVCAVNFEYANEKGDYNCLTYYSCNGGVNWQLKNQMNFTLGFQ